MVPSNMRLRSTPIYKLPSPEQLRQHSCFSKVNPPLHYTPPKDKMSRLLSDFFQEEQYLDNPSGNEISSGQENSVLALLASQTLLTADTLSKIYIKLEIWGGIIQKRN